jgi:3-phenylpropionate/cinnamic acid dioxygenase small subunit
MTVKPALDDCHEIQQLLYRYCEIVDDLDWDAMGEVFSADTVGIYNGMEVEGLATLISSGKHNMTRATVAATQHNVSNTRFRLAGEQVRCVSNYYAVHFGAGSFADKVCAMWGVYDDTLRRTDAGWRIVRRDYTSTAIQGDERMLFAGEAATWNAN